MRISTLMMLLVAILAMSSCNKRGDKEIEKQFIGSWTAAYSEEEDGVEVYLRSEITFNEDNTYKQAARFILSDIGNGCFFDMTCEGKWYATKDLLIEEVTENSINLGFSDLFLSLTGMSASEAKNEFLADMKADDLKTEGKIISLGKDEITLSEDGKVYTLCRK